MVLPVETAVPCGLILNELTTNALKHAFPSGSGGTVTVGTELHAESATVSLWVRDTGVGLPAGQDGSPTQSLGLRLVQILAGQLRGTVEQETGPGAFFKVTFRLQGVSS
jgi:two-component sensor histidine kinase